VIIAVTESNNVYALNAITGAVIWQRNMGPAVSSGLPCGNINPVGFTGIPVVDLASRAPSAGLTHFSALSILGSGHRV
jgi:outer membrane protein assembly factor BamB